MEKENNRALWCNQLAIKFSESLKKSTTEFTWQEKADFLDAMIQYVELIETNPGQGSKFFTERIMKTFKSKLQKPIKEKLFKFFDQELAWVELEVIDTQTFNSIHENQGMSDEEYEAFLNNASRILRTEQYHHFIYQQDEQSGTESESLGVAISTKGRPQRSAGDNLTKLNQEQTALMIHFLKTGRLILKNEYLTDKAAGLAFNILTGYSPNSLRTSLSEKEIAMLHTKANLTEVYNALTNVTLLIKNELNLQKKT